MLLFVQQKTSKWLDLLSCHEGEPTDLKAFGLSVSVVAICTSFASSGSSRAAKGQAKGQAASVPFAPAQLPAWTRRRHKCGHAMGTFSHLSKGPGDLDGLSVPTLDVLTMCTLFEEFKLTLCPIFKGNEQILCVDHPFHFYSTYK